MQSLGQFTKCASSLLERRLSGIFRTEHKLHRTSNYNSVRLHRHKSQRKQQRTGPSGGAHSTARTKAQGTQPSSKRNGVPSSCSGPRTGSCHAFRTPCTSARGIPHSNWSGSDTTSNGTTCAAGHHKQTWARTCLVLDEHGTTRHRPKRSIE